MAANDFPDLIGGYEHRAHFGTLVGTAHPALDAHVCAAAGTRPFEHRREVSRAETDQRIVLVEGGHHDLADFSRRNRVAGAGTHDLEKQSFLDDHAFIDAAVRGCGFIRDQAEVCRGVALQHPDCARLHRFAQGRRQVFGTDDRFFQARNIDFQLVSFVNDQLKERGRADIAGNRQVGDRSDLHLGLPGAGRHHGAAQRDRTAFDHRTGRREVVCESVDHQIAGPKTCRVKAARGAPPVTRGAFRFVDRPRGYE